MKRIASESLLLMLIHFVLSMCVSMCYMCSCPFLFRSSPRLQKQFSATVAKTDVKFYHLVLCDFTVRSEISS